MEPLRSMEFAMNSTEHLARRDTVDKVDLIRPYGFNAAVERIPIKAPNKNTGDSFLVIWKESHDAGRDIPA